MVSGSDFPTVAESGGEQNISSAARVSYTDIFYRHLPYYLSIGMSADEFWYGDNQLKRSYRQAFEIKRNRENFDLWLQGRYMYDALCASSPLFRFTMKGGQIKPDPYTKEPYPLTEKETKFQEEQAEKRQMEEMRAQMEALAISFNTQFRQKQQQKEVIDDAGH